MYLARIFPWQFFILIRVKFLLANETVQQSIFRMLKSKFKFQNSRWDLRKKIWCQCYANYNNHYSRLELSNRKKLFKNLSTKVEIIEIHKLFIQFCFSTRLWNKKKIFLTLSLSIFSFASIDQVVINQLLQKLNHHCGSWKM